MARTVFLLEQKIKNQDQTMRSTAKCNSDKNCNIDFEALITIDGELPKELSKRLSAYKQVLLSHHLLNKNLYILLEIFLQPAQVMAKM